MLSQEGVEMKRLAMAALVFVTMTAGAVGASAHQGRPSFVAQPVIGTVVQPTPTSYSFDGTAVWTGTVDGRTVGALYRCAAHGPLQGALSASATFGGEFSCWADAALGGAPAAFSSQISGSVSLGKVSVSGLLGRDSLVCDGATTATSLNAARDLLLSCTVG